MQGSWVQFPAHSYFFVYLLCIWSVNFISPIPTTSPKTWILSQKFFCGYLCCLLLIADFKSLGMSSQSLSSAGPCFWMFGFECHVQLSPTLRLTTERSGRFQSHRGTGRAAHSMSVQTGRGPKQSGRRSYRCMNELSRKSHDKCWRNVKTFLTVRGCMEIAWLIIW